MASKTTKPKQKPGTFEAGNTAAVGNAGPTVKRVRRYVTAALRTRLEMVERGQELSNLHRIVSALVAKACRGDIAAIKLVAAYVEGLPTQVVDMHVNSPNARQLAEDLINDGLTPAQAAKIYQRCLIADDDYDDDEGETTH